MGDDEREQYQQEISDLKETHADEVGVLNDKIGEMEERITELQDAIEEIYNIAKRI